MPDHPKIDALRAIEARDPAGWETEPTEADFAAHRKWVMDTYGPDMWATYNAGRWGDHGTDPV